MVINFVTLILSPPTVSPCMPKADVRFVELCCNFSAIGLASFLAYNMVLVLTCTVYAFKTRKLPDNFNESRFISMCVYSTLVVWLALGSTYFIVPRCYHRIMLLSLALVINDSVALLFLFCPKVYVLLCLDDDEIKNVVTNSNKSCNSVSDMFRQRQVAEDNKPSM